MAAPQLIGQWALAEDSDDRSGSRNHGNVEGAVTFTGRHATFAGDGRIVLPQGMAQQLSDPFSISAWVRLGHPAPSTIGDLLGVVDSHGQGRISFGFHHGTSTGSQRNWANLFFGLDRNEEPTWIDIGHPGDSYFVTSLAVVAGSLFAGTYEGAPDHRGRVYRLAQGEWVDCGLPTQANAVTALAAVNGSLYAGASRYRAGGSGLAESPNQAPGGTVYRLDPETGEWDSCGRLAGADSVGGFAHLDGSLYAIPSYSEGLFRFEEAETWTELPGPGRRLLALGSYRSSLIGAGNDHVDPDDAIQKTSEGIVVEARERLHGGGVYQFMAETGTWLDLGLQPDTTQVYSVGVHNNDMYISTWPTGLVFRHVEGKRWENSGRLGQEQEVMGLVSFNGRLYGGTVPSAAVFRKNSDDWEEVGRLEPRTDVLYPRAASLAVFNGHLHCGTSPSGRVWAMRTGPSVSMDQAFPVGWTHVAGVFDGTDVELYVGGRLVSASTIDATAAPLHDIAGNLLLGSGAHADFCGDLADVRLFEGGLSGDSIKKLEDERPF